MTMAAKRCRECGAELELGPTLCPLCGHDPKEEAEVKAESYHSELRKLRKRLKDLRDEGAKVV